MKKYRQVGPGRPVPDTDYRESVTTGYTINADINLAKIAYDAASDGMFPVISNDHELSDAEVLAAYRYQPNLECRHHLLKPVQDAALVLLKTPVRIEALFCCRFHALLINALLEREIRTAMHTATLSSIPLYPELRGYPTRPRIACLRPLADLKIPDRTAACRDQQSERRRGTVVSDTRAGLLLMAPLTCNAENIAQGCNAGIKRNRRPPGTKAIARKIYFMPLWSQLLMRLYAHPARWAADPQRPERLRYNPVSR